MYRWWAAVCFGLAAGCVTFDDDPFRIGESPDSAPGGAASTGSGGSETDGSESGGSGSGGVITVPEDCPTSCNGGCAEGTCYFDCAGGCKDRKLVCPVGYACSLSCVGKDICEKVELRCASGQRCDWLCDGEKPCGQAMFLCEGAICSQTCIGEQACEKTELRCSGEAVCDADCSLDVGGEPLILVCGENAMCTGVSCDG